MLVSRVRAVMLGLLAVMLAGSIAATAASGAEAGPFWHHRVTAKEGEGTKIERAAPEHFSGTGGQQLFRAKIGTVEIEFGSPSVQVKGVIFNGASQGQIEAEIVYSQPALIEPVLKGCTVIISTKNIIVTKGYLMWKWNGEKSQLEEAPSINQSVDGIFSAIEPPRQKPFVERVNLENGAITTVTLAGSSSCGVLSGTFPITGGYVGIPNLKLKEFSKTVQIRVIEAPKVTGRFLQHYYNGERAQGVEVGLKLGGNPAAYFLGQTVVESPEEVAVFEK